MSVQIEREGINPGPSLAVLEVIEQEHMISHVVTVGHKLVRQLREMGQRRRHVGRIVGMGFMVGIDLVEDKNSRKPAKKLADWVLVKMKAQKILLAVEGQHGNVVYLMPPLCFTLENAEHLVQTLETVLVEAERIGMERLGDEELVDEERYFKTGDTDDEDGEETNQYEDMD